MNGILLKITFTPTTCECQKVYSVLGTVASANGAISRNLIQATHTVVHSLPVSPFLIKRFPSFLYPYSQCSRLESCQSAPYRRRTGPGTMGREQLQPQARYESGYLLPGLRNHISQRTPNTGTCGAYQQYGSSRFMSDKIQRHLHQLYGKNITDSLPGCSHSQ